MPNTLEESRQAAAEMFAAEQAGTESAYNAATGEENSDTAQAAQPEQSAEKPSEASMLTEAVNTAETAAQAAIATNQELEMLRRQNEQLMGQNQQLQGTIEELSRKNEEKIVEEVLSPPILDIDGLAYASEEERNAAMAKFAEEMSAFNRQQLMKELSPTLEFAKEGIREKERSEVISVLSKIPELAGISDMLPQLDRIIANNKWLQSNDMPMEEKYISAYAMARGVDALNTPPPQPPAKPTAEEMMKMYDESPEFRELIEQRRLGEIKQSQQVPPMSSSSGAAAAALNIEEKPKNLKESGTLARKFFGSN